MEVAVPHVVDFENVSTEGLESSPVADALAGLRANEARSLESVPDVRHPMNEVAMGLPRGLAHPPVRAARPAGPRAASPRRSPAPSRAEPMWCGDVVTLNDADAAGIAEMR